MGIKGFQGTSLLDFPGRVASLVFWGGCNLTCPFCHNPPLVLEPEAYPDLDPDALLDDLRGRQPFIDGVVISGGEPTLAPGIFPFLEQLKAAGLAVKLDTNGLLPQVVAGLLERGLVDYLAVDLKTSLERYPELHAGKVEAESLRQTIALCRDAAVTVEYRTTCVPEWVDEQTINDLGRLIDGAPIWALQQYHPEYALDQASRELPPYSPERLRTLADLAGRYAREVVLRGI